MGTSNKNVTIEYRFVMLFLDNYHPITKILNFRRLISCRELNENVEEINISEFTNFLEDIKEDYLNGGVQLRTALSKFEERYKAAKLKSISRLASYLYDLNRDLDPTVNIRSGSMIRVQVESVKRRKTEGSGRGENCLLLLKIKKIWTPRSFLVEKERKPVKRSIT